MPVKTISGGRGQQSCCGNSSYSCARSSLICVFKAVRPPWCPPGEVRVPAGARQGAHREARGDWPGRTWDVCGPARAVPPRPPGSPCPRPHPPAPPPTAPARQPPPAPRKGRSPSPATPASRPARHRTRPAAGRRTLTMAPPPSASSRTRPPLPRPTASHPAGTPPRTAARRAGIPHRTRAPPVMTPMAPRPGQLPPRRRRTASRRLKAAATGRRPRGRAGPAARPGQLRDLVQAHLAAPPGRRVHPARGRPHPEPLFRRRRQRPGPAHRPGTRPPHLRQAPPLAPPGRHYRGPILDRTEGLPGPRGITPRPRQSHIRLFCRVRGGAADELIPWVAGLRSTFMDLAVDLRGVIS